MADACTSEVLVDDLEVLAQEYEQGLEDDNPDAEDEEDLIADAVESSLLGTRLSLTSNSETFSTSFIADPSSEALPSTSTLSESSASPSTNLSSASIPTSSFPVQASIKSFFDSSTDSEATPIRPPGTAASSSRLPDVCPFPGSGPEGTPFLCEQSANPNKISKRLPPYSSPKWSLDRAGKHIRVGGVVDHVVIDPSLVEARERHFKWMAEQYIDLLRQYSFQYDEKVSYRDAMVTFFVLCLLRCTPKWFLVWVICNAVLPSARYLLANVQFHPKDLLDLPEISELDSD